MGRVSTSTGLSPVAHYLMSRCLCCAVPLGHYALNDYCDVCDRGQAGVSERWRWSLHSEVRALRRLPLGTALRMAESRRVCLCGQRPSPTIDVWMTLIALGATSTHDGPFP